MSENENAQKTMMTSMEYKVAVIIPTLNEERHIAYCLDSVMEQTFPFNQMDVIVVDGGSGDATVSIVTDYSNKYSNIRVLDNPKKIQAAAFNIGVKHSDAPIIIRLDAHAEYDSQYIQKCVDNIKDGYGNVGGSWVISIRTNTIWAAANKILNSMKFGIGGASYRVSDKKEFVDSVPFGCFLRSVVEEVGGMNEDLPRGEDNEYNYRIRNAGYKILFDPSIKAKYFARETYSASVKQMYANGFSIGILLYACPRSIQLRHFIPFLFVLSLFGLTIMSMVCPLAVCFLVAELSVYLIANIASCVMAKKKHPLCVYLALPILIFSVHISYGIGTFLGILKRKY